MGTLDREMRLEANEMKKLETMTEISKQKLISELHNGMGKVIRPVPPKGNRLKEFIKKYLSWF